ncbi:MAG: hypothetical protein JWN43_1090 [Gammaproteobacteria bacterium]|nr:hypothetical protein [Gammaproteobacteria bacterium]
MKLEDALKMSLDELRMQMLGVQVLFGFQFQGLFQDNFSALPRLGRAVDCGGLGLMVVAMGLLVAVPCQHRIVERGQATPRIFLLSMRYANWSLLPFTGAIACDLFVAMQHSFGMPSMLVAGTLTVVSAALAWYGLGWELRRTWHTQDRTSLMQTKTPLRVKIEQMLTEARVILPGAQALLGFQLIVMMTKAFDELPASSKIVHLAALMCVVLTIVLLISPAAIHRVTFGGADDPRMHSIGSLLIAAALLPLACAMACDVWIALMRLFGRGIAAWSGTVAILSLLLGLWFAWPLYLKGRIRRHDG